MQYAASNRWDIEQPVIRVLLTSLRVNVGSRARSSLHVFPTALCEIRNGRTVRGIYINWYEWGQDDEHVKNIPCGPLRSLTIASGARYLRYPNLHEDHLWHQQDQGADYAILSPTVSSQQVR